MDIVDHNPAKFRVGNMVKVAVRYPIGHYRVPMYLRGKEVEIIRILGKYVNPEEEAFGKNAGNKVWSYMIAIRQKALWPNYLGNDEDRLEIEVFEPWLEHHKLSNNE